VPCCFAVIDGTIVSAVDGKPKSTMALRRLDNIAANPRVSLMVDQYDNDWSQLWWVRVDGHATSLHNGARYEAALDALAAKYEQYRDDRPQGAVMHIEPTQWRSWSFS
jgi:PPOX class probable F420-dependent enzyme